MLTARRSTASSIFLRSSKVSNAYSTPRSPRTPETARCMFGGLGSTIIDDDGLADNRWNSMPLPCEQASASLTTPVHQTEAAETASMADLGSLRTENPKLELMLETLRHRLPKPVFASIQEIIRQVLASEVQLTRAEFLHLLAFVSGDAAALRRACAIGRRRLQARGWQAYDNYPVPQICKLRVDGARTI
eukprot:CAMPEP_0182825900 /NCGR_PEP_ID=MMETSP0006_2-20121128/16086_1 /TAXON_ID=97485 /ORGANISM="Prymnesium parvum, Strain Texoma1" /LENGTH=189 /DNA_ID=CAMNT_0024953027 /DNA_START=51 /DNA_END=620 /DNA_ORIENTATION=+